MFKWMSIRNLTTWNVMLACYTKAGELELARRVFSEMPIKDDVSWSTMIVGLNWLMKVTQGNSNSCVVIPYWRPFPRYSRCLHHVLYVCKSIVYEEKNCTSIHWCNLYTYILKWIKRLLLIVAWFLHFCDTYGNLNSTLCLLMKIF